MISENNDSVVTLLLPGLIPEQTGVDELAGYPSLYRMINGAQQVRMVGTVSLESTVLNWFHGGEVKQQNYAAALGYRLDCTTDTEGGPCMRVDPVFQQMDVNHAVLADRSLVDLSDRESHAIVEDLNRHFSSDGLRFESGKKGRWYCFFDTALAVQTTPPSVATGRNVSLVMPVGAGAQRWRSLLAEIEMLLYSHPVNCNRSDTGKTVVNSLWLWGEGDATTLTGSALHGRRIYTQSFYTRCVAAHFGVDVETPESFSLATPGQPTLLVEENLATAMATGDQHLRESVLHKLEQNVFIPLSSGLSPNGWAQANIWLGDDRWLQVTPETKWTSLKLWLSTVLTRRG